MLKYPVWISLIFVSMACGTHHKSSGGTPLAPQPVVGTSPASLDDFSGNWVGTPTDDKWVTKPDCQQFTFNIIRTASRFYIGPRKYSCKDAAGNSIVQSIPDWDLTINSSQLSLAQDKDLSGSIDANKLEFHDLTDSPLVVSIGKRDSGWAIYELFGPYSENAFISRVQ